MKAIRFEIPNRYGKFLSVIFSRFDVSKYIWKIAYSDHCGRNKLMKNPETILIPRIFSGKQFFKYINESNYYTLATQIEAYEAGTGITEIKTYSDFLHSDCVMTLIVVDVVAYSFYCKNSSYIDIINSIAEEQKYSAIELINANENDWLPEFNGKQREI